MMMQDLPNNIISLFYNDALAKAKEYIQSRMHIEISREGDDYCHIKKLNQDSTIWLISTNIQEHPLMVYMAIPPTFPDVLPKCYLSKQDYDNIKIKPIPHIDRDHFICTRDKNIVYIDENQPGQAIEKLLLIAIEIVNRGIHGDSQADIKTEFLAYWNDTNSEHIILTCPLYNRPYNIYSLSPEIFGSTQLIAPSDQYITTWLNKISVSHSIKQSGIAYCIPVNKLPDIIPNSYHDLCGFFNTDKLKGDIIICYNNCNDIAYAFKWHNDFNMIEVNGFRKGKAPLPLIMKRINDLPLQKLHLVRLDHDRLIRRAVGMCNKTYDEKELVLIGCGSIGSSLAMLLTKSGITNFILIDHDNLNEENIARHLCGCDLAKSHPKKSSSVKTVLEKHMPTVTCQAHDKNILDIMRDDVNLFDNSDLIITAIANMGAERRINHYFRLHKNKPVVYLWLEPYGIAGHILYITPKNGACFKCVIEEMGSFRYSVAAKNQDLLQRESGCQSTFTPYGAADLEIFCGIACKTILKLLITPPEMSTLTTWIGDKEYFTSLGHKISDKYRIHESYGLYEQLLDQDPGCEICKIR